MEEQATLERKDSNNENYDINKIISDFIETPSPTEERERFLVDSVFKAISEKFPHHYPLWGEFMAAQVLNEIKKRIAPRTFKVAEDYSRVFSDEISRKFVEKFLSPVFKEWNSAADGKLPSNEKFSPNNELATNNIVNNQ